MKLEWIEDFLEVANRKSFAEAAHRRGISRSAVGRRIRSLEHWIGAPLCERASAQVRLTPGGEAFRLIAEGTVRKLYQYRSSLHEKLRARNDDTVVFAAAQGVASRLFPPWLHSIEEAHGPVRYRLFIDRLVVCMEEFVAGRADFLLCYRFPRVIAALGLGGYAHVVVGQETFLPVCAPSPKGVSHTLDDNPEKPFPLLTYNRDAGLSQAIGSLLTVPPAKPHTIEFESHFAVVLKAMALDGRGVAWIAETDVRAELANGALRRAGGGKWAITVEARLYRPSRLLSPAAEALWAHIPDRRA